MGGKSNILDLFRFLFETWFPQPGTVGPLSALARRQGMEEVLWKGGQDKLLSIGMEFVEPARPDRTFVYDIELLGGVGGYVTVHQETLVLREGGENHQLIVRASDGRWLANVDSSKLVRIQDERSAMELAPPNWDGYPLKLFAQNWRFYQLIPGLMKQANQMTAGNILEPTGANLSAWLMWLQTRSQEAFGRIAEATRDIFPEVRDLLTWPTQQGTVYLASREQGLSRPTPLFQMSDGELAFIAFLSLIYAPNELGGTIFFIEEPENHLHPRLFETLVALERQVRQEVADRGAAPSQIIFTTHSPFVIDQMILEEIVWVEKRDGATRIVRPDRKPHLRKLVEDESLGLGDLLFAGALGEE